MFVSKSSLLTSIGELSMQIIFFSLRTFLLISS
ncbi:MAG: hypothetical protein MRERV_61c008 [Mycoplasmataceae bacterium RV_VA103A]|nr:MAG: hypothetical protein MRERV_61c008 [Mycoplasmataceae bacterium RV_VA103A]